jgi:hypothetical protein
MPLVSPAAVVMVNCPSSLLYWRMSPTDITNETSVCPVNTNENVISAVSVFVRVNSAMWRVVPADGAATTVIVDAPFSRVGGMEESTVTPPAIVESTYAPIKYGLLEAAAPLSFAVSVSVDVSASMYHPSIIAMY